MMETFVKKELKSIEPNVTRVCFSCKRCHLNRYLFLQNHKINPTLLNERLPVRHFWRYALTTDSVVIHGFFSLMQ